MISIWVLTKKINKVPLTVHAVEVHVLNMPTESCLPHAKVEVRQVDAGDLFLHNLGEKGVQPFYIPGLLVLVSERVAYISSINGWPFQKINKIRFLTNCHSHGFLVQVLLPVELLQLFIRVVSGVEILGAGGEPAVTIHIDLGPRPIRDSLEGSVKLANCDVLQLVFCTTFKPLTMHTCCTGLMSIPSISAGL